MGDKWGVKQHACSFLNQHGLGDELRVSFVRIRLVVMEIWIPVCELRLRDLE